MSHEMNTLDLLLDEKRLLRQQLKNFLKKQINPQCPVIGIYVENEAQFESVRELFHAVRVLGAAFVLLCDEKNRELIPFDFYDHVPVAFLNPADQKKFIKSCDVMVCFSEDMIHKSFQSGVVPVTSAHFSCVRNYDPNAETGNAFVFSESDHWNIFAALVRAMETYRFPFDWKCIIRNGDKATKTSSSI